MSTDSVVRYAKSVIAVHWLTAFCIFMAIATVLLREVIDQRDVRTLLMTLHRSFGLLAFGLTFVRLVVRFLTPAPQHSLPLILKLAAKAGHLALYAGLFIVPLMGWVVTNAKGREVTFFGLPIVPRITAVDQDFGDMLAERHELLGWLLIAVVVAHAAAAIWHHKFRRDQVLVSMLPDRFHQNLG